MSELPAGGGENPVAGVAGLLLLARSCPAANRVHAALRQRPPGSPEDVDSADGEHFLDHAQAERGTEIESDSVTDDLGRDTIAAIKAWRGSEHDRPHTAKSRRLPLI